MAGFTGIPGQTRDGAKAYADALFSAYKAGKLPLQTKSERSRPNLDTWGKWKREAIKGHDRASSEFLHKKSPGEKAVQRLLEDPKALSGMSAYDFQNLKGYLMMEKLGRHGMSLLASLAESAAHLAPDSWKGVAFDIVTLVVGGAATKLIKLSKLGKLAMPVAKTRPLRTLRSASRMRKAAKSTHGMNVAIGRPELTGQMLKIQKANEIVSGATVAKKTMEAVHAGHMIHKSAPIAWEGVKDLQGEKYRLLRSLLHSKVTGHTTQKRTLTSRTPFSQHPLSQIGVSNISKPLERFKRRSPRPKGPSHSFIDPVKIADWSLRYEHRDTRPLIHTDKPFMSTVDRLKALETRAIEQRRMYKLMDRFKRSISKPYPSPYSSGQSNLLRQSGRTLMNPNRARPMVRAPAFR